MCTPAESRQIQKKKKQSQKNTNGVASGACTGRTHPERQAERQCAGAGRGERVDMGQAVWLGSAPLLGLSLPATMMMMIAATLWNPGTPEPRNPRTPEPE